MPGASEAVKHKRDEVMLTGIRKTKCPCCGHEFIAMDGGVVNAPVRCPKCGTEVKETSILEKLLDALFGKRENNNKPNIVL